MSKLRELKNEYAEDLTKGGFRNNISEGISILLLSEILEELKKLNSKEVRKPVPKKVAVKEEIKE